MTIPSGEAVTRVRARLAARRALTTPMRGNTTRTRTAKTRKTVCTVRTPGCRPPPRRRDPSGRSAARPRREHPSRCPPARSLPRSASRRPRRPGREPRTPRGSPRPPGAPADPARPAEPGEISPRCSSSNLSPSKRGAARPHPSSRVLLMAVQWPWVQPVILGRMRHPWVRLAEAYHTRLYQSSPIWRLSKIGQRNHNPRASSDTRGCRFGRYARPLAIRRAFPRGHAKSPSGSMSDITWSMKIGHWSFGPEYSGFGRG